jgi:hypothetical protein
MNELLLGSLIDKVDAQDRKIEDLNKKIDQIPPYEQAFNQVQTGFEGLRADVQKIFFPVKEMSELSERLTGIELLKRLLNKKLFITTIFQRLFG